MDIIKPVQVHFGVELLRPEWDSAVACIGTFDGVHLGHQEVIRTAVRQAQEREWPCVLVTFDRHPAHVLAPDRCPHAIAALQTNLEEFAALDVAAAVILPFNRELSQTSADDFYQHLLVETIRTKAVVVGHDFGFGRGREGNPEWLRARVETSIVPPYEQDGRRVSSSIIRQAVAEGDMGTANRLLGRPFEVPGVVVAGQKLGRQLGWPTVNVARSIEQVTPADGVYVGEVECKYGTFRAAVSIGMRPAVQGTSRTIEAYLLDYPGESLYGSSLRLRLLHRLRPEQNFASIEDLKSQIEADVRLCRDYSAHA